MAASLAQIAIDTARTADITARESRLVPASNSTGDSFKTALAEARKPARPSSTEQSAADRAAAARKVSKSSKKHDKTASATRKKKSDAAASADSRKPKNADATDDDQGSETTQQGDDHAPAEAILADATPADANSANAIPADANTGVAKKESPTEGGPVVVIKGELPVSVPTPVPAPTLPQQEAAANIQAQPLPQTPPLSKGNKDTKPRPGDAAVRSAVNVPKAKPSEKADETDAAAIDPADSSADTPAPLAIHPAGPGSSQHASRAPANVDQAAGDESQSSATGDSSNAPGSFSELLSAFGSLQSLGDAVSEPPTLAASAEKPVAAGGLSAAIGTSPTAPLTANSPGRAANAPDTPQAAFAAENHPSIVQAVRTELLPNGGTMHIRLDPPELGALQVSVHMKDGVMSASFQTNNDEATKLLSHSMGQLKDALESQGITVGKMHVQQTPRNQNADARGNKEESGDSTQQQQQDGSTRQEQQRREALQRMWQRLSLGSDPLDLVA